MPEIHPNILALLDNAVGLAGESVKPHLARCEPCARRARGARQLVGHGRRMVAAPTLERKHVRLAMKVFRSARVGWVDSLLRLVTNCSLGAPALALRARPGDEVRFLRFEGALTVELQVRADSSRATLLGCVLPSDGADTVRLEGAEDYRSSVDPTGGFSFRDVPCGEYELRFGAVRTETLRL